MSRFVVFCDRNAILPFHLEDVNILFRLDVLSIYMMMLLFSCRFFWRQVLYLSTSSWRCQHPFSFRCFIDLYDDVAFFLSLFWRQVLYLSTSSWRCQHLFCLDVLSIYMMMLLFSCRFFWRQVLYLSTSFWRCQTSFLNR